MCICLSKFVNAGIVNSLPRNGHEGAHVPVRGRHERYESLIDETWTVMPNGEINQLILMSTLCLV